MNTHTPGPWRVGDTGATVFGPRTDSPAPEYVAYITRGIPSERNRANARLIAAAPRMYEYLASRAGSGDIEASRILESIRGNAEGD